MSIVVWVKQTGRPKEGDVKLTAHIIDRYEREFNQHLDQYLKAAMDKPRQTILEEGDLWVDHLRQLARQIQEDTLSSVLRSLRLWPR